MHNWINIHKGDVPDLKWLIYGYNGFNKDISTTKELEGAYDSIIEEYEAITRNQSTEDYYDLLIDISKAQQRIDIVSVLLDSLAKRPLKTKETLKEFVEELNHWRFYINLNNPIKEELEKMLRQLKAAQSKLNLMVKEKKDIEKGLKKDKMPIRKLKQRVENVHNRTFDFKVMTVSEWIYALEDAYSKKKSA